ncbi:MAG: nucleotidyltransferase family protein [Verrucomicrobiales bacterium]
MQKPTLLVLAAGMGSRYGGLKQLDAMGPNGEAVIDYSVFDAVRAGFGKVVFIIRRDFEAQFKEHVGSRFEGVVDVAYAFQQIDDLPGGFSVPDGREKPWGTGQAILSARSVTAEPFAAINADDFYGRDAFEKLAGFLKLAEDADDLQHYSMVGFRLRNTLSDFGSVSRGICESSSQGMLESVTEMTGIERTPTGAEQKNDDGSVTKLTGEEIVSMNMWGFTPGLFAWLEEKFVSFLGARGTEMKSEFYIPSVVDELIREGRADTTVLETESTWFGVTYQEDKPHVIASIKALIDAGEYPESLWG